MPENIEWASPEKTECWSFRGRLYQTLKKAEVEQRHLQQWKEKHKGVNDYWKNMVVPPIYHIKWEWSEVGEENNRDS